MRYSSGNDINSECSAYNKRLRTQQPRCSLVFAFGGAFLWIGCFCNVSMERLVFGEIRKVCLELCLNFSAIA